MARGRKRKPGKREKNGRLSRAGLSRYDKGTERVQAMQELYGQDGCDAIGRAYRLGFLGEGNEAKAMLDMGRSISNAYWAAYAVGRVRSALGDPGGSESEGSLAREQWLNEQLRRVSAMGHNHRKAFYQLVIDINPDCGPDWLDKRDMQRMALAREALAMLTEAKAKNEITVWREAA